MTDNSYRLLLRQWQTEPTRELWIALLAARRRMGDPVFTLEFLQQALQCDDIESFDYTPDGFTAKIENAQHPRILLEFRISYPEHEYEGETFPVWDTWDGTLQVIWPVYEGEHLAVGPELELTVDGYGIDPDSDAVESIIDYQDTVFVYEGGDVTNQQQLFNAVREDIEQWTT